jgi:hypothetical protein
MTFIGFMFYQNKSVKLVLMKIETPGNPGKPGKLIQPTSSNVHGWKRWLPGLEIFANYKLSWLTNDLTAGLVLTTMLVPVGIAYAEASGVPGIYGLYATIIPLLVYALFGPSRIMVLGP